MNLTHNNGHYVHEADIKAGHNRETVMVTFWDWGSGSISTRAYEICRISAPEVGHSKWMPSLPQNTRHLHRKTGEIAVCSETVEPVQHNPGRAGISEWQSPAESGIEPQRAAEIHPKRHESSSAMELGNKVKVVV